MYSRIRNLLLSLQSPIFLLAFGFFIGFVVDPRLIAFRQDPVFLLNTRYFQCLWGTPGGPVDYGSAFLLQLFVHRWIGALILTMMAVLVVVTFRALINRLLPSRLADTLCLVPLLFLTVLCSRYDFPLAVMLGIVLALSTTLLYQKMLSLKIGFRLPILFSLTALLYYLLAGPYLLFVFIVLILEGFCPGRKWRTLFLFVPLEIVWAAAIPLLFNSVSWVIGPEQTFLKWIVFPKYGVLLPFFYLCFVLILLASCLASRWKRLQSGRWMNSLPVQVSGFILLAAMFVILMFQAVDVTHRSRLRIRLDARDGRWEALLAEVRRHPALDAVSAFHMHRALYHVGRLGDEMFLYPQEQGLDGLIPLKEKMLPVSIDLSDFWMELGHYNEAEHWAHEALTQEGETARILSRLAEVNLIKNDRAMAESAITLLGQTLNGQKAVMRYRQTLANLDKLPESHWINRARANWIDSDFLVQLNLPEMELVSLFKRNPNNHVAYAYLMAYYLMARQLDWFVRDLEHTRDFPYKRLPIHWEEALIIYMVNTGRTDPVFAGFRIQDESFDRFRAYQEILQKYEGNRTAAHAELRRKFGGTYWYYLMYTESNLRTDVDGQTGATP